MGYVNKIAAKYILNNRSKVWTACTCIGIMLLLIVVILQISNGVESYMKSKYGALSDAYVVLTADYYADEFEKGLNDIIDNHVKIAVKYDKIEFIDNDNSIVKHIVATNDETIHFLENRYYANILARGRFFNDYEKNKGDYKAIICEETEGLIEDLQLTVGKKISLFGKEYTIIGEVEGSFGDGELFDVKGNIEIKEITLYIPLKNIEEEIIANSTVTYYIELRDSDIEKVEDYVKSQLDGRIEYNIFTSTDVSEEINGVVDIIRIVFLGISTFSIVTGILILMNTIKLIIMDLTKTLIFFRVIGIKEEMVKRIIFLLTCFITSIGVFMALGVGVIIQALISGILDFELYLKWHEVVSIVVVSILVSYLAFLANVRYIKRLNIMDFFRN